MIIRDFEREYIADAQQIALMNYNEEREAVPELPYIDKAPDLEWFADNGLGVAAFDKDKMIGYLCCFNPWDNAFGTLAKGTFSPIHAHGAVKENRVMIYKRLYQAAAAKWVENKIAYHGISLYAHDSEAAKSLFTYGFGMRCVDAIRSMETVECSVCEGINYQQITKTEEIQIRDMRRKLSEHLGISPCFMYSSSQDCENWIARAETRDTRVFIAKDGEKPVAFIEVGDEGENFVTEVGSMKNICGAYCVPEMRGTGVIQGLLNYIIMTLKQEGYELLGVDFESFNPTAYGFWTKNFKMYTNSVVRRVDECAIHE